MKKLLGILGSIGMLSSWASLVVACGELKLQKSNLNMFNKTDLGLFNKIPTESDILDEFNRLNNLWENPILIEEVTIEIQDDNSVIITANSNSEKYTGSTIVTFEVSFDSTLIKVNLTKFNDQLSSFEKFEEMTNEQAQQAILDKFNEDNKEKLNNRELILNTDVTIEIHKAKSNALVGATITANPESIKCVGSIFVQFSLKTNIKDIILITDLNDVNNMSTTNLFKVIKTKNENSGFNINWIKFEKHIDWDQTLKSFTENTFEIIMENNDVYFGSVKFTFENKILKEAKPEQTVYVDKYGEVKSSNESIKEDKTVTHVLQIGYETKGKDVGKAHQLPLSIKYVPSQINSNINNLRELFYKASEFNDDISGWDVSNVTNMSFMFIEATIFNQDLSNWDVSQVTSMDFMFAKARKFNSDISGWNVSQVTSMGWMFQGAYKFNQDLSSWDVSNVVKMDHMFDWATDFDGNISNWNTINVKNMSNMFYGAKKFNGNISGWNVSNVTDMTNMFRFTSRFNQNLSSWIVIKVTKYSDFDLDSNPEWLNIHKPKFIKQK